MINKKLRPRRDESNDIMIRSNEVLSPTYFYYSIQHMFKMPFDLTQLTTGGHNCKSVFILYRAKAPSVEKNEVTDSTILKS
ncbi:hypothetical protein BpHYR1_011626 [Brachionus plicatilis]|uniref:Uncharacterized protein n=1 Tax=Brachionus plicatilis TaxID=10195 RepID=A0A3M7SRA6_BRAPC|nr:hypothetical protein BpHYR1_011626 [Brachionus plicatilis]